MEIYLLYLSIPIKQIFPYYFLLWEHSSVLSVLIPHLVTGRPTIPTYTHTHTCTLHLSEDAGHAVWEECPSFLTGLRCQQHSLGHPSSDHLNLFAGIFLFPTPLCPLVWLVVTSTSLQAPSSMAEPEEEVGLLHCNHGNAFQRCSPQSLWVFQFSMAASFLRGYVYPSNKHVVQHISRYSVKYIFTVY